MAYTCETVAPIRPSGYMGRLGRSSVHVSDAGMHAAPQLAVHSHDALHDPDQVSSLRQGTWHEY